MQVPLDLWDVCLYTVAVHSPRNWSLPLLLWSCRVTCMGCTGFPSLTVCAIHGEPGFLERIQINCWYLDVSAEKRRKESGMLSAWINNSKLLKWPEDPLLGAWMWQLDGHWMDVLIPISVPEFYACIQQVLYLGWILSPGEGVFAMVLEEILSWPPQVFFMMASCRGLDSVCVQWCRAERTDCRAERRVSVINGAGWAVGECAARLIVGRLQRAELKWRMQVRGSGS